MTPQQVGVGIIGGGLMGRELAAAIGRWAALEDHPVRPRLIGVCDTSPDALAWFDRVDGVRLRTVHHEELLADDDVEVVYIAVPHHLHERLYLDAIAAGKDLFAEKPFGIDLEAATRIVRALRERPEVFVRCSSEFPFFPGAQLALETARSGALGELIEAESAFLHSSDIDRSKPINWKRQVRYCGEIGVMGDLGLHAAHVPLRLGWRPRTVFAQLQDIVTRRPGPDGRLVPCDTIDNATLHCDAGFPLTLRTYRIAPGHLNTWRLTALGMEGGVSFSTSEPKAVHRFALREGRQVWERLEVGSQSVFPTITGGIFKFGFPDAVLQMWAAFLAERADALGERFGCATPEEALESHRIFAAALRSAATGRAELVGAAGVG
ncbi:MAG TPA: Gfo/Idh/MocA family oxidoreductase [Solirubrobacterales bacterium]|nr:Gfo/Idh/MocA family oxidoreductase [Solirubrobacterales bacterium]